MKLKNILFSLIAVLATFMGVTVKADTTAPSGYGIKFNDMHRLYASNYLPGDNLKFYYKVTTDGKIVYCIDQKRSFPTGNPTAYTRVGELSNEYVYIMENGFPNRSLTGDNDKDYFITGMAIWYIVDQNNAIFNNFNLSANTYKGVYNDVVYWMNYLVTNARNSYKIAPVISISNSNSNMTLSSDGNYYVSTLSAAKNGAISNYNVSLTNAPAGTIVTDANGTVKNTFSINEKFTVKVPVASINTLTNSFKVNVSATATENKAYLYSAGNSIQRTTALYPEYISLGDSATLNINVNTRVEVSKVDATTGTELPGAKLTVKNASNVVVDTWTSTSTVHVISGLKPGKYTLTEEIAPEGYELSKTTVEFTIKADGSTTKVKMENKPEEKLVYISKVDSKTGARIAGAKLEVKDSKGKVVDSWTSTTEVHTIKGLKPGKYTLVETSAPKGYTLNTTPVAFEVTKAKKSVEVKMENKLEEPKTVFISKQDATTGEELPGAKLELKKDGKLIEAWISESTPHKIVGLEAGKYTLTEILAPEGYELSKETVEFTVKADGTVDTPVVMYNKPETIVVVPSTSSFKTITTSLIGLIIMGLGSIVIFRNYKKNNG